MNIYTLKNGLKILLVPMQGVKSAAVGVFVGTGSRHEGPEINGISHFIEHMAFKGTKNYPTTHDTSRLEGLGAIQNAWTDVDATCYYCKIPSDKWEQALDLVKDLALYPTFPTQDLEVERGVIIEEIRMYEDKPEYLAGKALQNMLYGKTNLGQEIIGTEKVIKSLTRDQFIQYHQSNYMSANMLVCLAGDISENILPKLESIFANLPATPKPKFPTNSYPAANLEVKIQNNRKIKQAHLALGGVGMTVSDSRRFTASVLFSLLGQGLSSRLFLELREKRGVCYSVMATIVKYPDVGHWEVYAGLNVDKLEAAVAGIVEQLEIVKNTPISEQELAENKEKLRGSLLFAQENPIKQMEFYARQVLDCPKEVMDYDTILDRLMQVSVADVQSLAQDLFQAAKFKLAVVGPVDASIKEKLLAIMQK